MPHGEHLLGVPLSSFEFSSVIMNIYTHRTNGFDGRSQPRFSSLVVQTYVGHLLPPLTMQVTLTLFSSAADSLQYTASSMLKIATAVVVSQTSH